MNSVIIVAGGSGSRFESEIPKQFVELSGKPILMHSMLAFYNYQKTIQIIIVLPQNQLNYWKMLCEKYNFKLKHDIAKGGKTRFDSVKNGMKLLDSSKKIVAIHDGVRPLVSQKTISSCFILAKASGNAIPTILPVDSVRQVSGAKNSIIPRSNLRMIQTPQIFSVELLQKAYQQKFNEYFTDDASVVESFGEKINLVEGNIENIKITNKVDLILAQVLYKYQQK